MARSKDYETKVVRPVAGDVRQPLDRINGAATEVPACKTCPLWREHYANADKGICHGTQGPIAQTILGGMFAETKASDWCILHPLAPKPN